MRNNKNLVDIITSTEENISNIFKGKIYTFLNPVSYIVARKHKELFSQFDGIFADGEILVKAIKIFYRKTINRRSFDMTSIASQIFQYAQDHHNSIYIIGSKDREINTALKLFKQQYPEIKFVGHRNGYFSSELEEVNEINKILKLNPDFLIVGMGIVSQEKFLLKVRNAGFNGIGFTCGGFIHQTSKNEIDYYPLWINKYNLRFLYRFYKEKHTRSRYIKAAVLFPIYFIIDRIK